MATHVIPIQQIQAASAYGSGLTRFPLSRWYRNFSIWYAFPKIVHFVTSELTNERIERLNAEQAKELYMPVAVLHRELGRVLDRASSSRARLFIRGWMTPLERDAERLGDVAEALAWGSDPDLRKSIDGALTALEQEPLHF